MLKLGKLPLIAVQRDLHVIAGACLQNRLHFVVGGVDGGDHNLSRFYLADLARG
ncbi:hypothetical protein D3C72_2415330 [compost metagenome]